MLWIFPQVENKNEPLFLLESVCIGCYFLPVDSCYTQAISYLFLACWVIDAVLGLLIVMVSLVAEHRL